MGYEMTGSSLVIGYEGTVSRLSKGIKSLSILLNELDMTSKVSKGESKISSTDSIFGSKNIVYSTASY